MNFAAAGDFPLGIVPGFRYNETESDISGAEEKMLKFKIMLVVFIALVYYGVTYCMLSPGICKYYADYYLLSARSFSIDEWNFQYGRKMPKTRIKIARKYLSSEYPVNLIFKIDGAVSPKSLGFGQENRKFGLIFNSLTITPDD